MIQKMMIEIESSKPISSYGDGHILVLDGTKNRYYVTTRESFLSEQDKKIKDLFESFDNLSKNNSISMMKMREDIEDFKSNMTKSNENFQYLLELKNKEFKEAMRREFNDFLTQYKDTNEKMLNLIKQVVISEE
jgi:hypothetical protein